MSREPHPVAHRPPLTALPVYPDRFVGRDADLERLHPHLTAGRERLLTLTGTGGSGKTRLAVTLAGQLAPHFAQGTLFVDCSTLRDANSLRVHLAAHLADAFGHAGPGPSLDALLEGKQVLLVLDNLEQIEGAGAVIAALLAHAPLLRVLATSRTALRVRGERRHALTPLGLHADSGPSEAAVLLLERARAVHPDFAASSADAPVLEALARQLDGLPLALELVAVRASLLTPQQMLRQLREGTMHTLPSAYERHRSLSAVVQWSYDLLSEGAQRLFRQLAVFEGGFTLGAAQAVLEHGQGEAQTLAALLDLAERHLLGCDDGDPLGFRMLLTLRQFALERLGADKVEHASVRERHARYYTALAEGLYTQANGPEQRQALRGLERDQAQFEAAFAWWVQGGLDDAQVEPARTLTGALHVLNAYLGDAEKVYRYPQQLYAALPEAHQQHRAQTLDAQAQGALRLGRLEEAASLLAQAARLARPQSGPGVLAAIVNSQARLEVKLDRPLAALPLFAEAVALWRAEPEESDLTNTLHSQALLHLELQRLAEARQILSEVQRLDALEGTPHGRWMVLLSLGMLEHACEHFSEAERCLRDALAVVRSLGVPAGSHRIWLHLARVLIWKGDLPQAEALLDEVGSHFSARLDTPLGVHDRLARARLALARREQGGAAGLLEAALDAALLGQYGFPLAAVCHLMALHHHALGQRDQGVAWLAAGDDALRLRPAQPPGLYAAERAALSRQRGGRRAPPAWTACATEAQLKDALRLLHRTSRIPVQADAARALPRPAVALSLREQEVLLLVAQGFTNKRIAAQLGLSPATIDTHLRHLFAKLECKTRTQAVTQATQRGWI